MIPILIRKDPDKWQNIPHDPDDFGSIIGSVELFDISNYIVSAIEDNWAPAAYWKCHTMEGEIHSGELQWLIYSYLAHKGLLVVEDCYFGYNPERTQKNRGRCDYYNPLEKDLYKPIINRMVKEKYLTDHIVYTGIMAIAHTRYKLGPLYRRSTNLANLSI